MPRKPDTSLKPAILQKVTQHLVETKLEDVSVRSLGRVLGTSAYPIVYHFGTRDALIDAVVDRLTPSATLDPDADADALADHLVTVFGGLDDPERALAARLTFELGAVEALDGRDREQVVHRGHVAAVATWCRARGYDADAAALAARGAVLAARGAQWAALIDGEPTETDDVIRAIAHGLAVGTPVCTA